VHARSALFTLLGDVVRPAGGEAWLTALTAAMGALDFTPEATRTALHRMTAEGWVEPRRIGRYAAYGLTARGVDRLEEAAARIYRLRAADWDGRWRLLLTAGDGVARELGWMGFGRLRDGVWVSPHDHGDRLAALLGDGALTLTATEADDQLIVAEAWDLGALRRAHADFLARWDDEPVPADPRDAFVQRIRLVHDWRSFLFLDPGLPPALLPADWLGGIAAARFAARYDRLAAPAWVWWAGLAERMPALATDPLASPFTRGLDALATTALTTT